MKGDQRRRNQAEYALKLIKWQFPPLIGSQNLSELPEPPLSYYRWKKIYGGMEPSEARELKQLREENMKLKRLVADPSLDKVMLQDVLGEKF
jgi:transposase